jgi:GNAT superfamily N-acetyltransferase
VSGTPDQHRKTNVVVREMAFDERAVWEALWDGYLDFYETKLAKETKDVTWARLHNPNEPMFLLAACVDGRVVGIVHFLYHRSCWTGGDYCYLQDLFVTMDARGKGVGEALIQAVENKSRAAGASQVYWLTKEDNFAARTLYDKLASRSGFIQYRKLF